MKNKNIDFKSLHNSKLYITDKEIEVVADDSIIFKGKVTKKNYNHIQKIIKLSGGYIIKKEE